MRKVEFMISGRVYVIRKRVIDNNKLIMSDKDYNVLLENIQKFIMPFAIPLGLIVTDYYIYLIFQVHDETLLRNMPRNVRKQQVVLSGHLLQDYIDGKIELNRSGNPDICSAKYSEISDVITKRMASFYQSFTRQYNHRHNREDRLFSRKSDIFEVLNGEDLSKILAIVANYSSCEGDQIHPIECKTSSCKDVINQDAAYFPIHIIRNKFNKSFRDFDKLVDKYWHLIIKLKEVCNTSQVSLKGRGVYELYQWFEQLEQGQSVMFTP